jgi:hypothetical protein
MHVNICYCLEAPYAPPAISITILFLEKSVSTALQKVDV